MSGALSVRRQQAAGLDTRRPPLRQGTGIRSCWLVKADGRRLTIQRDTAGLYGNKAEKACDAWTSGRLDAEK